MLDSLFSFPKILLLSFLIYLLILLVVYIMAKSSSIMTLYGVQKRWRGKQTIIAVYEPPHALSAVELGFIFDRNFSDNELAAVVISLAQKNVISIDMSSDGDWTLIDSKPHGDKKILLDRAEQPIADYILTNTPVSWASISSERSERAGIQGKCEDEITQSLITKDLISLDGYFDGLILKRSASIILSGLLALATIWLPLFAVRHATHTTGLEPGFQAIDEFAVDLLLLPLFAASVWLMYIYGNFLVYIYFRSSGLPLGATAKLRTTWPEVIGFREYLKTVEFNRLSTSVSLNDPVLPYCVALGFDPTHLKLS